MTKADFPANTLTQWHRMCELSHSSELDILSSHSLYRRPPFFSAFLLEKTDDGVRDAGQITN